ncbi:MAG: IPT/TIG domain-containing protein, partial [Gemmatimonadota bacterium]
APTSLTAGPTISSLQVLVVSGDQQTGVTGRPLPDLLTAKVTAPGVEVRGVVVLFEVRSGGGRLADTRVVTDINGNASMAYTLGPAEGVNEVVARLELAPPTQTSFRENAVGPPRVDAVAPGASEPNTVVTVQGANFSPIPNHNQVLFGLESAVVTQATPTALSVLVPTFAEDGPVSVTLTGVTSNAAMFDALPAIVTGRALGEVQRVELNNNDGTVTLPFESSAQQFTMIIQSVNPTATTFTTRVRGLSAAGGRGGLVAAASRSVPPGGDAWVRALERQLLPGLPRPGSASKRGLRVAQDLGSLRVFNVVNRAGAISLTDRASFDRVSARLRFIGDHTYIYVDERTPAANLTEAMIEAIGTRFDDQTYATDRAAFGPESDVDGNGKVIILLSQTINKLTTPDIIAQGGFIAGFFFGIDLLPHPVANPFANGGEVFYAVVPDPNAAFGSARISIEGAPELLNGVFAHEFEHMISANHHVLLNSNPRSESLWLDEGLAHMAETLNGIHRQNRLRAAFFLHNPPATSLVGGGDALDERGAAWLFVQYLVDHFGEAVLARLVQTSRVSVDNVDTATDRAFVTLFHEWTTALLLDGTGLSSDPAFDFPSLDVRGDFAQSKLDSPDRITGEYLGLRAIASPGGTLQFTQDGTSPVYVDFTARARANVPIVIDGATGSELQVTVVRTR